MPVIENAANIPYLFKPKMRVFIQGLASEPAAFCEAMQRLPEQAAQLHFFGALVPGINLFDYASLHPESRYSGLFLSPINKKSIEAGRAEQLLMHYYNAFHWFAKQPFEFAVIQISSPDANGRCSLGVNADFAKAAIKNTKKVIAYVNTAMPYTAGPTVNWCDVDYVVEIDRALPEIVASKKEDPVANKIAGYVASLIRDGDCLSLGVGKIPEAVLGALKGHRDLGIHSGLVTEAVLELIDSGAINGARKTIDQRLIVTGAVVGSQALYDRVASDSFLFADVSYTHAQQTFAQLDNFVSINSAIEVDLQGQVNSETINGKAMSGVGGAVDFIRGSALSKGGRSIIALPSMTPKGQSRIVALLAQQTPVTVSRADAAIIVTEYGIADLRGLSVRERFNAMRDIAHPDVCDDFIEQN